MTSRMLPRIEPTSEALTTSCSPLTSAKNAMISSGALPKVTFSSPPIPGPDWLASSSVALPISAAVGMTPSADVAKISVGDAPARSSTIAIGMNGTRAYGQPSPLMRNRLIARAYGPRRSRERCGPSRSDRYGVRIAAHFCALVRSCPASLRQSEYFCRLAAEFADEPDDPLEPPPDAPAPAALRPGISPPSWPSSSLNGFGLDGSGNSWP